jgi:arylsulfatase A-like enzyme
MFLVGTATYAEAPRPNIIVILVDDMGFSDFGCYGSEIRTPHLDRLASEGLRFARFYNTPRCSPTRASLLTGLYPHEAGMGYLDGLVVPGSTGTSGRLQDRAVTVADVLGTAGYFTAMVGKWHIGQQHGTPPWERGFQHSLNLPFGGIYFPDQKATAQRFFHDGKPIPLDSPEIGAGEWYSTDVFTDWGMRYIDQAREEKKPYFLYLSYCAPHFPLMAPAEDIARYRGKYLAGWDKLREARYERQVAMGLIDRRWPLSPRLPDSPAWDSLTPEEKDRFDQMMAIYAAMIDRVDQNVGRLVDHLRQQGTLDHTAIFVLSDNGGNAESGPDGVTAGEPLGGPDSHVLLGMNWAALCNTPFSYFKHFTREGGIATPFIVHWPAGIPAKLNGRFVTDVGHVVDVMPTCVELAGAQYPTKFRHTDILPEDGISLIPAFSGAPLERPRPLFWAHEGNRAIREGRWKLVSRYLGPWQLYDMEADRTEIHDVAAAHADLVLKLSGEFDAWAAHSFVDSWEGPARNDWGQLPNKKKHGPRKKTSPAEPAED